MVRMLLACSLLLPLPVLAQAASPDPKSLIVSEEEQSRAEELVQQLGSAQFVEREKAEAELSQMGRLARAALLEGATADPDPEVRSRCATLLPRATSLDLRARLEVFLEDQDGKFEHDLPGWNQLLTTIRSEWKILGHVVWVDRSLEAAARGIFVDMVTTAPNRQIVMGAGGPMTELGLMASARRQELYSMKYPRAVVIGGMVTQPTVRRDPSLPDIAALLFVESLVPSRFNPRTASISVLISASGFSTAARATDDKGKVYRAIAIAWLNSRTDPVELSQAMSVATTLGMPDQSCQIALRLLSTKGVQPSYRGNAAATLARLGNANHIPVLEGLLTDTAVVTTVRVNQPNKPVNEWPSFELQTRDVALAVSVLLSGQKLEDYGYTDQFKANGAITGAAYSYTRFYLTEETRKTAFEKWKAWREKNP